VQSDRQFTVSDSTPLHRPMTQGDSFVPTSQQQEHEWGSATFDHSSSLMPSDCREPVTPSNGGRELVETEQFEDDETHGQLHLPLHFGKETRILCMTRLHDTPGEFTLEFDVVDANLDKISLWLRAPESVQYVFIVSTLYILIFRVLPSLDFCHARCISLVCYSTQDIRPYAIQQCESHEHEFENFRQALQPVPCTKILPVLLFSMNNEFTLSFPLEVSFCHVSGHKPLTNILVKASEHLLDISQYIRLGLNKLCFSQADSMSEYVLVLYSHYPTESQIEPLRVHWDDCTRFRQLMAWLVRPIPPDEW
jgi:hypothetical protein